MNVGKMLATLGLDSSDFTRGAREAQKEADSLASKLKSSLSMGAGFAVAQAGINGFTGALKALGSTIIGTNSQLEQSEIAFTQMLGSAERAQKLMKDIRVMSASTPFELPGLVQAAQRMINFGFNADTVLDKLRKLGDAAAASPNGMAVALNRITLAMGQMNAKGKVSAGEMLQLVEAGVPAWSALAKVLGTDVAGAMKQVESGTVFTKDIMDKFIDEIGAKFPDMMAKQSKSFAGLMSTIKDSVNLTLATAFRPLFDAAKKGAEVVANLLSSGQVEEGAKRLSAAISNLTKSIIGMVKPLFTAAKLLYEVFARTGDAAAWVKTFSSLPAPLKTVVLILSQMIWFIQRLGTDLAQVLGLPISDFASGFMGWKMVISAVVSATLRLASAVKDVLVRAWASLEPVLEPILGPLEENLGLIAAAVFTVVGSMAALSGTSAIMGGTLIPAVKLLSTLLLGFNPIILAIIAVVAALFIAWDYNFLGMRDKAAQLVTWFQENWPQIQATAIAVFTAIAETVGPIIQAIVTAVQTIAQEIIERWPQIQATAVAIWTTVSTAVLAVITGVIAVIASVVSWVQEHWGQISTIASGIWNTVVAVVTTVFDGIRDLIGGIVDFFTEHWGSIGALAKGVWDLVLAAAKEIFASLMELVRGVATFFRDNWSQMKETAANVWAAIRFVVETAMQVIKAAVEVGARVIRAVWGAIGDELIAITKIAWELIKSIIGAALTIIGEIIKIAMALINGDWSQAWDSLKKIVEVAFELIFDVVRAAVKIIWEIIKGIKDLAGEALSLLFELGKNVVQGLINGVLSMAGALKDAVAGLIEDNIPGPVRSILRIFSPSKLMEYFGTQTIQGMIVGITKESAELAKSVVDVLNAMIDAADKAMNVLPRLAKMKWGPEIADAFALIADLARQAIAAVFNATSSFNKIGLEHVGDSSDAISSVFGAIGAIAEALNKLKDLKIDAAAVQTVTQAIDIGVKAVAHTFEQLADVEETLRRSAVAADFAENAEKVFKALEAVVSMLIKAAEGSRKIATVSAEEVFHLVSTMVAVMEQTITYMNDKLAEMAPTAGLVAENAAKVFEALTKFITVLEAASTSASPEKFRVVLQRMTDAMLTIFNYFITVMPQLTEAQAKFVTTVIPAITGVLDTIKTALDLFLTLSREVTMKVKTVADEVETSFMSFDIAEKLFAAMPAIMKVIEKTVSAVQDIMQMWQTAIEDWSLESVGLAGEIAEDIRSVIGALKDALDLFKELGDIGADAMDFDDTDLLEKAAEARQRLNDRLEDLMFEEQSLDPWDPASDPYDDRAAKKLMEIQRERDKALRDFDREMQKIEAERNKRAAKRQRQQKNGSIKDQILRGIDNFKSILDEVLKALEKAVKDFNDKFGEKEKEIGDMLTVIERVVGLISGILDILSRIGDKFSEKMGSLSALIASLPQVFESLSAAVQALVGMGITEENIEQLKVVGSYIDVLMGLIVKIVALGEQATAFATAGLTFQTAIVTGSQALIDGLLKTQELLPLLATQFESTKPIIEETFKVGKEMMDLLLAQIAMLEPMVLDFESRSTAWAMSITGAIDRLAMHIEISVIPALERLLIQLSKALAACEAASAKCAELKACMESLGDCGGGSGGSSSGGAAAMGGVIGNNGAVQALAQGGVAIGGVTLVGEKGPELAFLPKGTTVLPHDVTSALMSGRIISHLDYASLRDLDGIVNTDVGRMNVPAGTTVIDGGSRTYILPPSAREIERVERERANSLRVQQAAYGRRG